MSLLRLTTFAVCFVVIHQGTRPDHQMATLAAILIICALLVLNASQVRR